MIAGLRVLLGALERADLDVRLRELEKAYARTRAEADAMPAEPRRY